MSATGLWYFIQWFHYLALSLWIGGITFLCAVVAPAAHRSIASRSVAGQIVGAVLKKLNMIEVICCFILIATSTLAFRFVYQRQSWLCYLILMIILMGLLTGFYAFHLTPRMDAIKERVPTLDSLSMNHPAKAEFHHLHQLYVGLMSLNLVFGLAVLYASVVILK